MENNEGIAGWEEQLKISLVRCGQKLGGNSGTHQTQGRILKILYLQGPMTQKVLQDKLGIQSGSMSEIAAKLERKGLLRREKDTADKRKVFLTLTDAGREDVERFEAGRKTDYPYSFDVLTEAEQETLRGLLERLLESWDR